MDIPSIAHLTRCHLAVVVTSIALFASACAQTTTDQTTSAPQTTEPALEAAGADANPESTTAPSPPSSPSTVTSTTPQSTSTTESADVPATAGPGLPTLVADTVGGAQIDTNSLEGQDVVVWFWAPW